MATTDTGAHTAYGEGPAYGDSPAYGRLSIAQGMVRQADYWWTAYKRTWRGGVISSFVAPLFYVLAMGVLLGGFIDVDPARLEGATSYLAFIVPGLVATHAMTLAIGETTYPVMGGIKWHKTYYAQLATPLTARDIVNAHLMFVLARVASACAVFLLVLAPFGVFATWWGPVAAFFVVVLVGMAFATVVFGISTRLRDEAAFGLVFRLGVVPMSLFSGAFFPVANLGDVLSKVAQAVPLWHGVNLTRMLCLDTLDGPVALLNVTVLVAITVAGWLWAIQGLERRLSD
ncbi:lipooligosaccharide transport system permease protein [Knoellia remsis]|uniref:Transport permease protein n=1 Tax=Knoellia remsis TaxID=407159 RepID=A0A2T0TRR8_9MICO|nr:ABC transporter permease [Knoellia remsis]PRY48357.1 lipooligosaccharide transport system permease protein [Knoellia remsis]